LSDGILFVCSGNICRSPMAALLARRAFDAAGVAVAIESAGTLGIEGAPADPLAVEALARVGLDLGRHRSQAIHPALVWRQEAVVVMAPEHASAVATLGPDAAGRVVRLWEFAAARDCAGIEDPIGQDRRAFEACRDLLTDCLDRFVPHYLAQRAG